MKKIVNTVFYLIILFMVYALISELKKEPSSSTSVEINDEIANTIPNDSSKLTPLDLATINLKEDAVIKEISANMIIVNGGEFTMGCTIEQGDECYDTEKPSHKVKVATFKICKYEVTRSQWAAFMGFNKNICSDCCDYPAAGVSWNEAKTFINKLNEKIKSFKKFRLPTEAEWEYAARGGNKSKGYKCSGTNDPFISKTYFDHNCSSNTHPVGKNELNELGIYDMSGNVWEWVEDSWHDDYQGAPSDGSAWISGGNENVKILRGGSWDGLNADPTGSARVSDRFRLASNDRHPMIGLRLVQEF